MKLILEIENRKNKTVGAAGKALVVIVAQKEGKRIGRIHLEHIILFGHIEVI